MVTVTLREPNPLESPMLKSCGDIPTHDGVRSNGLERCVDSEATEMEEA